MTLLRPPSTAAWEVYKDCVEESSLPATELMSDRGFRDYIDRLYTPEEQCIARKGRKKAFLEHGIFIPQDLPDIPLDEVEIDHCLVDVILIHKNGRIAGRPWITVLLDRATRCVLGIHITFQPPSYHSVRLAIAHSAYPKDLSTFPSIKRKWACFGVPKYLISDQGKEFKCASFKATCAALDIIPVPLPGRSPWLKGAIERLFGYMGIAVFDLMDGATKFNDVEAYRSAKSARLDKDEFTKRLIRWIVDRYHHRPHPKLEERYGRGTTPDMAWQVLTSRYGIRLARDPEQVHLITGEIFNCRIRSDGIRIGPQWYLDKDVMERLRKRHGPGKVWRVHRDDTDWGYIRLLDDTGRVPHWITIPNANREVMSGVSREQFKIILDEARQMTREGAEIQVATLARAKNRLERESAALQNGEYKRNSTHKYLLKWTKYGDLGTLVTPVPGFEHQVIANDQDPLLEDDSFELAAACEPSRVVSPEPRAKNADQVGLPQVDEESLDELAALIEERMKLWRAKS
ncbi:transposase family protein [Sphingomonas sediminicola]|uniref:integrase catalytic domain-containing protein n=1 Tax=Sphingomonas sediminicola TaxID=386874 RepID=UPI003CE89FAA